MSFRIVRYHDFSYGHRVAHHESRCSQLHGHNGRVHFTCEGPLDYIGRVLDFSAVKSKLCMWLEEHWDHRFLAWENDTFMRVLCGPTNDDSEYDRIVNSSIVWVPFNPTAENMAEYLLRVVGPQLLDGTSVTLTRVVIDETRKCSAIAELHTVTAAPDL